MRVLVDSAALIWWFVDDPRLGPEANDLIEDPSTEAYASVASVWEIGIKEASGKLSLEIPAAEIMDAALILDLPIRMKHASTAAALPRHHSDPFDRMIVAQAKCDGFVLLTPDLALGAYEVPLIDARR